MIGSFAQKYKKKKFDNSPKKPQCYFLPRGEPDVKVVFEFLSFFEAKIKKFNIILLKGFNASIDYENY